MKCIPKRIQTLSISKLTSKHLTLQKLNGWGGCGVGGGGGLPHQIHFLAFIWLDSYQLCGCVENKSPVISLCSVQKNPVRITSWSKPMNSKPLGP